MKDNDYKKIQNILLLILILNILVAVSKIIMGRITRSGLFLVYAGFNVILEAIGKIKDPVEVSISPLSLIVMLFTLGVNIIVAYYEYKKGNELNSPILIADSLHTRSDIFVTVGVIVT